MEDSGEAFLLYSVLLQLLSIWRLWGPLSLILLCGGRIWHLELGVGVCGRAPPSQSQYLKDQNFPCLPNVLAGRLAQDFMLQTV